MPTGSVEQHGPHLPLDVDTVIAVAVAERVAAAAPERPLVAPAVAFGASGEHQSFPGTVSAGSEALARYLVELGRSLSTWAARIVFVNGHGGNADALRDACRLLRHEGRDAAWLVCPHGDIHAGPGETSLMLFLAPERVQMHRAVAGAEGELRQLLPAMRAGGMAAVTASGVIGDPRGATAAEGERILARMTADALHILENATLDDDCRLIGSAA